MKPGRRQGCESIPGNGCICSSTWLCADSASMLAAEGVTVAGCGRRPLYAGVSDRILEDFKHFNLDAATYLGMVCLANIVAALRGVLDGFCVFVGMARKVVGDPLQRTYS